MEYLFDAAEAEVNRARSLFPKSDHLLHALTEEYGEVVKAALDIHAGKGSYDDLETEIIQLIAMCIRLYEEGDPTINLRSVEDHGPGLS
jgi:hypothetical protein